MWALLARALSIAATASVGWFLADAYNEYETTEQMGETATIAGAARGAVRTRWYFWVIGFVILLLGGWLVLAFIKAFKQ